MSEYATCPDCGQAMAPGAGCLVERVQIDGIGYPRQPYGEGRWDLETYCDDCGVTVGQYHHTECNREQCPVCRGVQVICGHIPNWTPYRPAPAVPSATEDLWTLPLSERGKVHLVPRIGAAFLMLHDGAQLTGLWMNREEARALIQQLQAWAG